MATSSVDQIREIGAKYWKPLITIISAIMAGLTGVKTFGNKLGLPFLSSAEENRWLVFGLFVAVIVIVRFPAVAVFITRLILGKPRLPAAAGRIFHGPRAYHRGDKLPGRQRQVDDFAADEELDVLGVGVVGVAESGCGRPALWR